MMKLILIAFTVLVVLTAIGGCKKEPASRVTTSAEPATRKPFPPEVQSLLDRLNAQCASDAWRSEIDMIERPETHPKDYIISGEVTGFIEDCKESLAARGVQVKWNHVKKVYEAQNAQQ